MEERVMFVICPIGGEGSAERAAADKFLKYIVQPVADDLAYRVERADTIMETGTITSHIFNRLISVPLVVADLTGHNPNVFYELAARHAAAKPVVHMITKGQSIPFDVAPQRTIFYELELDAVDSAKSDLAGMIRAIEQHPDKEPESPITSAVQRLSLATSDEPDGKVAAEILAQLSDLRRDVAQIGNPPRKLSEDEQASVAILQVLRSATQSNDPKLKAEADKVAKDLAALVKHVESTDGRAGFKDYSQALLRVLHVVTLALI